ncbi:Uncharacterised protein [uncultured archaeon]|nr:Uncharacterised protein [uncultured archaeon]
MARVGMGAAFVFMLLASVAFAYWSEKIDVYAIGSDGKALKNATVDVVYQSTKCGDHVGISKQTDGLGVAHFEFVNTVDETFNPACVEHSYTMTASLVGFSNSTIGFLNNSDKKYFIRLPLLQEVITVVDSSSRPVSGASAAFAGTMFSSDASGTIYLSLPSGTASDMAVSYRGIVRALKVNPSDSASITVTLPIYDLQVRLFDEFGRRINGTVEFGGDSQPSTSTAPALFPRFAEESAGFSVIASGKQKIINTTITSDTLDIYFDFAAPSIRDVRTAPYGRDSVQVTAAVADDGTYASGLASNPTLGYAVADGGYTEVKMYPASANTFEATVPAGGQNVSFSIIASDKQSNVNRYEGTYSFSGSAVVEVEEKPSLHISPLHLIGVFVFILVVVFIYQKIKEQA